MWSQVTRSLTLSCWKQRKNFSETPRRNLGVTDEDFPLPAGELACLRPLGFQQMYGESVLPESHLQQDMEPTWVKLRTAKGLLQITKLE